VIIDWARLDGSDTDWRNISHTIDYTANGYSRNAEIASADASTRRDTSSIKKKTRQEILAGQFPANASRSARCEHWLTFQKPTRAVLHGADMGGQIEHPQKPFCTVRMWVG
jgi:hypothetical protein